MAEQHSREMPKDVVEKSQQVFPAIRKTIYSIAAVVAVLCLIFRYGI